MKYLFYVLIAGFLLFCSSWTFNHVNAWLGIGLGICWCLGVIYFIINQIKKIK
jgi:hypothetical protein